MDDSIPVSVKMHVECPMCGHTEDETYEFELPHEAAEPMESEEPAICPRCNAPVVMHLKRTQRVQ